MVSLSLLTVLSLLLVTMTNSTASTWRYTTSKIEQFRSAGDGFEAMARRIGQATLNTYWDYDLPSAPTRYLRKSDLRFIAGVTETLTGSTAPHRPTQSIFFQAPLGFVDVPQNFSGLANLLNTWGYYLEFNRDNRPEFLKSIAVPPPDRYRYRLMELMQPSNNLNIYSLTNGKPTYNKRDWFTTALSAANPPVHVLAENVIAMVILPKLSKTEDESGVKLAPKYSYDSSPTGATATTSSLDPQNQLPPVVQITLVAIDEASANRIADGSTPPTFDTLLGTLFADARKYDEDLKQLQDALIAEKINYRVFTSNVSIRGAKWSRN